MMFQVENQTFSSSFTGLLLEYVPCCFLSIVFVSMISINPTSDHSLEVREIQSDGFLDIQKYNIRN